MCPAPTDPAAALRDAAARWPDAPEAAEAALAAAVAAWREGPPVAPAERARVHARLGQMRVFLGRVDDALRILYDALEFADDGYVALQLGNALLWRGDAPALEEAEGHVGRALTDARRNRDGPLAIGALCARGELHLLAGRGHEAVEAYGEALGVSEFSSAERPSIAPLAGLARAHAAWRAPAKAGPLAERALDRARRVGDATGEARALGALAAARGDATGLAEAERGAERAPHRPLALRIGRERLEARPDEGERARLLAAARAMGLRGEAARLAAAEAAPRVPGGGPRDPLDGGR